MLCSWADWLRSCRLWLRMSDSSLLQCVLNIHRSGALAARFVCCMAGATWNCCYIGGRSVYTIQLCTTLRCHFIRSNIRRLHVYIVVTYLLHLWQNDRDMFHVLLRRYGSGTDTEIRVSTDSWPWRTKIFRRFCWDSNPRPLDHESGALPLNYPSCLDVNSPLLMLTAYCWCWLPIADVDCLLLMLTPYCWCWLPTVDIDSLLLMLTAYCWCWLPTVDVDCLLLKLTP